MGLASLVFQVGGAGVLGLGAEGNVGAFITNGRLDMRLYAQGGLSVGAQIPGVSGRADRTHCDTPTPLA